MFTKKHETILGLVTAVVAGLIIITGSVRAGLVGNANQATLSLSPATGSYSANNNFAVSIYVNTGSRNVVVVAAYLNYDKARFQAVSIDSTGSVFSMQAENTIDSTNGAIKITRGIPTPGVNTTNGLVAKINFKALANASPSSDNLTFQFTQNSVVESNVILDDGLGTDYLRGVYNAMYTVTGGTEISATPTPSATPFSTLTPTPTPTPVVSPSPTPIFSPLPSPSPGLSPVKPPVKLIRFSNNPKVYEVTKENQIKWVPSIAVFNQLGYDWKSVTVELPSKASQYQRVKLMRAEGDTKVYYITEGGLKRHMPNPTVFLSYGNKWSEVVTVKSFELSDIPDDILIREEGKPEVYKLENSAKRWIKTAEAFNRLGFKWNEIAPVNATELGSYPLGMLIE